MTSKGIFILGLNGAGKTTLGRALAEQLGWFRMDVEDYYFPDMSVPFANSRTQDEVERLMLEDIRANGNFVLSSVSANLCDEIRECCALAVWLRAPKSVRMSRIEQREAARFGARVLPGGDMYEQQQWFHEYAGKRNESIVARAIEALNCPALTLNAERPIEDNLRQIIDALPL